jgi:hypothetical protein
MEHLEAAAGSSRDAQEIDALKALEDESRIVGVDVGLLS